MPEKPDTTETERDQRISRSYLVRIYESACKIAHESENDIRFREAIQRKITAEFGIVLLPASASPESRGRCKY